ncbi:MAG: hypothetical protein K2P74_06970 [Nitrosomonas sp.]|nr:hypothetical protein [Nitrosomonas sp.]MBY0579314.1 hypothetical protein [Burkholderiales bacterium]
MKWRKLGVVWQASGDLWWARKYATCPTPLWLKNGTLRIYIQCRDEYNVGRIGFVDIDPENPLRVLRVSESPVLDVGAPGSFDDNGVFQTSVVPTQDGRLFMYFVGFELCHRIRYRLLTGLAVSYDDGESFKKVKTTPILERSATEMHFRCGPFVSPAVGGGYRMWYVAGGEWEEIDGKTMPVYDIRYAESADGINWPEEGRVVLSVDREKEHGFGRPYVVQRDNFYQLFYGIRKKIPCAYRMGYAESSDGLHWVRKDAEMGLDVSDQGWDSDAIEYAAIVKAGNRTLCFYNGNDFGATGFGVAMLEVE